MSRDFDNIIKKIDQSHADMYNQQDNKIFKDINNIDKNQEKTLNEIKDLKKEIKNISFKVDMVLEILNNFTIMLSEESEDEDAESWIPEQEEDWNSYEDDEDDEDE